MDNALCPFPIFIFIYHFPKWMWHSIIYQCLPIKMARTSITISFTQVSNVKFIRCSCVSERSMKQTQDDRCVYGLCLIMLHLYIWACTRRISDEKYVFKRYFICVSAFFVPLLHPHVSFCFPSENSRFRIFPMFWLYNIDFPIISFPNRKVHDKISFNQTEF